MLHIVHAEEGPDPTQTYAQACWLENPAIAPAWWHQVLGHTTGKIALDATASFTQPELLTQGVNLILTSSATHSRVLQSIAAISFPPETFLLTHLTAQPHTIPENTTFLLWQVPAVLTEDEALPILTSLEEAVKQGRIQAYGIADADLTTPETPRPLHRWLEWAGAAAQQVYRRRKRSALQLITINLSLLTLNNYTQPNTLHKEEAVSAAELAHRLGLATLALCPLYPKETPPSPTALEALTAAAQAEHVLHTALGGWPTLHNQPLFSILQSLGRGVPPWPTPAHWQHWQRHLYPLMSSFLEVTPHPEAGNLKLALQNLLPFGPQMALAAAQPHLNQRLSSLAVTLPVSWQQLPAPALGAALLSSLPGLAALALPHIDNLQLIQTAGDYPDPAILFTSSPHLS